MGGRREVSVISHRPVTSSDLKHERLFFLGSVSTFLQLVLPTFLEWIEPNFLSHWATLQHARPTDGLTPDSISPPQSMYDHRRTGRGGEGGCSAPKFWAAQIFWAARENLGKASS